MRTNIYYWKCDSPLPAGQKRAYNEKYKEADITDLVRDISQYHFRGHTLDVIATGSAGNHYAYLIKLSDTTWFFRADDGKTDDDYMDAESAVMAAARDAGVPVPQLFAVDTTLIRYPIRYQILEHIDHPSLREHDQSGQLNRSVVSEQLGGHLARLHGITGDRFGFLNTDHLRAGGGGLVGLDVAHADYFHKCLPDHLGYLRDVEFLSSPTVGLIEKLFDRHSALLKINRGALLHKDLAFWNVLGTSQHVAAIVDWDDAVLGDPADDLAIVRCFYDDDVFEPLLMGYRQVRALPEDFDVRLWLYVLRNMLWKAKIRHFMGYFDMDGSFFIRSRENQDSLEAFTHKRIQKAMDVLSSH